MLMVSHESMALWKFSRRDSSCKEDLCPGAAVRERLRETG